MEFFSDESNFFICGNSIIFIKFFWVLNDNFGDFKWYFCWFVGDIFKEIYRLFSDVESGKINFADKFFFERAYIQSSNCETEKLITKHHEKIIFWLIDGVHHQIIHKGLIWKEDESHYFIFLDEPLNYITVLIYCFVNRVFSENAQFSENPNKDLRKLFKLFYWSRSPIFCLLNLFFKHFFQFHIKIF